VVARLRFLQGYADLAAPMTLRKFSPFLRFSALVVISATLCPAVHAQASLASADPDGPTPFVQRSNPPVNMPASRSDQHRFWDKQNCALFVAAAALNTADFAVTRANLLSGGHELNPVVRLFGRSTPGRAMNFIGETAGVISLSYFFHKTGHHKLERAVSLIKIGSSAGAVGYGLAHR
jgi:hypothetical protein